MLSKEKIDRINALSRKSREEGLTEAETAEQAALRKEYIAAFRSNVKSMLDNTVVQYPDGTRKSLKDRNK